MVLIHKPILTVSRERVILGRWLGKIGGLCLSNNFTVSHIKAHTGNLSNDMANNFPSPPLPLPAFPKSAWQLSFEGDNVDGPHRVWSMPLIPSHTGVDIHPRSWQPWKRGAINWFKWVFGTVDGPGFVHRKSFWFNGCKGRSCTACLGSRNQSVHGVLAFCSGSHTLVHIWLHA